VDEREKRNTIFLTDENNKALISVRPSRAKTTTAVRPVVGARNCGDYNDIRDDAVIGRTHGCAEAPLVTGPTMGSDYFLRQYTIVMKTASADDSSGVSFVGPDGSRCSLLIIRRDTKTGTSAGYYYRTIRTVNGFYGKIATDGTANRPTVISGSKVLEPRSRPTGRTKRNRTTARCTVAGRIIRSCVWSTALSLIRSLWRP